MAKQTKIQIIDDLDGAELDEFETIRWSLDGKNYEFDTSTEHAAEFRDVLAKYIGVSRTTGGRTARRTSAPRGASANTRDIRQWATANGYAVSDRGRIPAEIVAAYEAAN